MVELETLIELSRLEKENRRNILEEKLSKQDYYGEIEELFDLLTESLSANGKKNLELGKQPLRALNCQNRKLDKQTKAVGEAWTKFYESHLLNGLETQDESQVVIDTDILQATFFI